MAKDEATPARRVARGVVQRLESLERAGVTHLRKPRAVVPAAKAAPPAAAPAATTRPKASPQKPSPPKASLQKAPAEPAIAASVRAAPAAQPTDPTDDRAAALAAVAARVARCTRCKELAKTRTQTVFGVGDPHARLVFMGEAPGQDEDRQGIPFVGRAGQLLTDIIVKGMRLRREDVYILNTLKCRPPDNRAPLPDEAANCREYLDAQLAILKPEFICCLGAVASQNLLGTTATIGSLRRRIPPFGAIQVLCTYHPAYVLRNPPAKAQVWEDIQMLMKEMGLKP
jgi:uracil-DNA glycosylase